jgi:hypothetical protein
LLTIANHELAIVGWGVDETTGMEVKHIVCLFYFSTGLAAILGEPIGETMDSSRLEWARTIWVSRTVAPGVFPNSLIEF